jgi:hypothetical protein
MCAITLLLPLLLPPHPQRTAQSLSTCSPCLSSTSTHAQQWWCATACPSTGRSLSPCGRLVPPAPQTQRSFPMSTLWVAPCLRQTGCRQSLCPGKQRCSLRCTPRSMLSSVCARFARMCMQLQALSVPCSRCTVFATPVPALPASQGGFSCTSSSPLLLHVSAYVYLLVYPPPPVCTG